MLPKTILPIALAIAALAFAASPANAAPRLYMPSYASGPPEQAAGFDRGANGSLTPIAGSPFPIAAGPVPTVGGVIGMAFAPAGDRAVTSFLFNGGVQGLAVAPDGSIAPAGPALEAESMTGIAVSPDGRFAYAPTRDFGGSPAVGVRGYAFAGDGKLTELAGSPFGGGGTDFNDVAITPDGRFLYTLTGTGVRGFAIGADGALTALTPVPVAGPASLQVSPDGRLLLVGVQVPGDGVASYSIGADGGLTANGAPALTGDVSMDYFAVAPDGRHVYMPDGNLDAIVTARVAADGTPEVVGSLPIEDDPRSVVVSPDGRYLYYWFQDGGSAGSIGTAALGADGLPAVLPFATPWDTGESERLVLQPTPTPAAAFTAKAGVTGAETAFDAGGSARAARFDWDFGDGTRLADGGPTPRHRYAKAGAYEVRLTVADEQGCSLASYYTGQSTVCPGGGAATATRRVVVADQNVAPVLGRVSTANKRFAVAPAPRPRRGADGKLVRPKRVKRGTTFSYRLSEAARVRFTIERRLVGRKVGGRCRAATPKNAKRKPCQRWKRVGSFTANGRAGANATRFSGRIGKRRLAPGRYRAVVVATDPAGARSVRRTVAFRVLPG